MTHDDFTVPVSFWRSYTKEESLALVKEMIANGGYLEGEHVARLWRHMELNTEPPKRVRLFVNAADIKRLAGERE